MCVKHFVAKSAVGILQSTAPTFYLLSTNTMLQISYQITLVIWCGFQLLVDPDLSFIIVALKHLILERLFQCMATTRCLLVQSVTSLQQLQCEQSCLYNITAAKSAKYSLITPSDLNMLIDTCAVTATNWNKSNLLALSVKSVTEITLLIFSRHKRNKHSMQSLHRNQLLIFVNRPMFLALLHIRPVHFNIWQETLKIARATFLQATWLT